MTFSRIFLATAFASVSFAAHAEDQYLLTLKNHAFTPSEITIPADKQVQLVVKNDDDSVAEFESSDLDREKIIPAKGQVTVNIGPLKAGTYAFEEEYHDDTAKGTITVK